MDFDLPLPEELELLEQNYRINEEEEDYRDLEPYPYEEKEEDEPSTQYKSPSPSSPDAQINGHKRSRSLDGPDASVDEKRSRIDEEEEDWIRYSPPPEATDSIVEERVGEDVVEEEKLVWKFASEIDGDFVPVTDPSNGDRVYAKITKEEEKKERQEKLVVKSQSGGLFC